MQRIRKKPKPFITSKWKKETDSQKMHAYPTKMANTIKNKTNNTRK